jgi:type I restriction enzyme S subunit
LGSLVANVNDVFDRKDGRPVRYVAGEHIDEGQLRIRRFGLTTDDLVPPTFNRLFKAGDVLFHSRNIRKLAQPDFDGLTGEKLFVLRTKDQSQLMQEFLPFLLRHEHFGDYVQERWAGSTNKFLNQTPLMQYELALPPAEEQRKAVAALLALNESIDCSSNLLSECNSVYLASLDHLLGLATVPARGLQSPDASSHYPVVALQDVIDQSRPISYGILQPGAAVPDGIPMLRTMDFDELGRREKTELFRVTKAVEKTSLSTRLEGRELLISVMATIGRTFIVPDSMAGYNVNRALAVIAPNRTKISSEFLQAFFHSRYARRTLEADKIGSAQARINLEQLRMMRLPLPSIAKQHEIVARVSSFKQSVAHTEARYSSFGQLREAFLRELLG